MFVVLLAAKVWLAATIEPLVDEGFYWQCAQRPAIAYVDHPPLTAMLVRAGTDIFGHSVFGVRVFFLVVAALFPWIVFALARPLVGRRDAWFAAGATLLVPGTAYLGLLAIPDVLILLWTALLLLALERATRGSKIAWPLAGLAAALGLATHYRFSLECVCAIVFLTATRSGRAQWKHSGPWIATAIACIGFAPALIVNLREDFEPLRYYLSGRNGSSVDPEGWPKFIVQQLGVVGPLMLVAFAMTLVHVVRRARAGDDRAQLAACFSLIPIGLFFAASALESSGLATLHWPVAGYLPLFAYLPLVLRDCAASGGRLRRAFVVLAPTTSAAVFVFALYEFGSPRPLTELSFRHLSGARETAARLEPWLADSKTRPVLVVDNYEFGARLAYYVTQPVDLYVLDHKVNRVHGRGAQYAIWHMAEANLASRAGENAILVLERGADFEHSSWVAHVRSLFDRVEVLDKIELANPRAGHDPRRIRILRASGIRASTNS